jgi:competence ComEA-like helix-hairpin-helix protein
MKQFKKLQIIGLVMMVALVFSAGAWAVEGVKVNINTASVEELSTLKYIGEKYAQKIIEHRKTNGPFVKAEDILNVQGIGPKTLEVNKDKIVIN